MPLRPAFKQAMQRYHRVVVNVYAVVSGEHGERWTKAWQQAVAGGSELS